MTDGNRTDRDGPGLVTGKPDRPGSGHGQNPPRRGRRRKVLVNTAALPATCTIMNGLAGFASIHFATKDAIGEANLHNLTIAAWLIGAGMVFDVLDGRLARITRKTSDFGAQLDSLCDVITFGVAPAMLMLRTVTAALRGQVSRMYAVIDSTAIERTVWCLAAIYVACTVLRLARFNVETDADENSHMTFRGLPSPAAAAAIATLVLLFTYLAPLEQGWRSSTWLLATVGTTLPVVTLAAALLMVSSFQYTHIVNYYFRGPKRFGFLVKIVVFLVAMRWQFYITSAVLSMIYMLSGPTRALAKAWRASRKGIAGPKSD